METDEIYTIGEEGTHSDDNYSILCPRSSGINIFECNLESCYFHNPKFKFNCIEIHSREVLKKDVNSKILNIHLKDHYLYKIGIFIIRIQIMNKSTNFCHCGNIYDCECSITREDIIRLKHDRKWKKLCQESKDCNKINLETVRYYIADHIIHPLGYYVLAFDKFFSISDKEKHLNLGLTKQIYENIRKLYENN